MYNIFNSPNPRFDRLNFKYPFSPIYKVFKAININTVSTQFFLSVAHMPTDDRIPIFQAKDLAAAHILFLLVFFSFTVAQQGNLTQTPLAQALHQGVLTKLLCLLSPCSELTLLRCCTNSTVVETSLPASMRNAIHQHGHRRSQDLHLIKIPAPTSTLQKPVSIQGNKRRV